MSKNQSDEHGPLNPNRRQFIRAAGVASAVGALAVPYVHAQEGDGAIKVALIGSGGRGTGAVGDALSVEGTRLKLVAMADIFEEKLKNSHQAAIDYIPKSDELVDVPAERRFIGFDAYRMAMDQLDPGDIVILATPLAFRVPHFEYAIDRGLHVFMEKPLTADGPNSKRMLELSDRADEKNLKCGVGLMVRHCRGRRELHQRIQNGEIGDVINMRAYRMHGPVATCFSKRKPDSRSELMWQIERFHSFLWASGGLFNDFNIHQIDETCWMKNAWPVKASGIGGRHFRGEYVDQNFDTYSVEYTFDDGSKLFFNSRIMPGCANDMSSVVHGSNGSAIVSTSGHTPGKVRIFRGQRQHRKDVLWAFPQPETSPYRLEWVDLVDAIVNDKPYNEVRRGVAASVVSSMGRMAAHTGQEITYDQMLNCPHEFAPNVTAFTSEGPAPVTPDANGRYPTPQPGIITETEYEV